MFVDWRHGTVSIGHGYALPNDVATWGVTYPTKDSDPVKEAQLWYGAKPTAIPAPYLDVRRAPPPDQVDTLGGWARMALPTDGSRPRETLRAVFLEFSSNVLRLPDGRFLYWYTWRDRLASAGNPFSIRWISASVSRARETLRVQRMPLQAARTGVFLEEKAVTPAYAVTVVDILDAKNETVGRASATIYYPSNASP